MANWSNPLITSQYDVFVNEAKDRDVDSAQMFLNAPMNPPVGIIRLQRVPTIFQEWNGSAWVDKVLGVAGGGTGGSNQASAVAGLGLGTMSTQNSNAVAVTGGTVVGLTGLGLSGSVVLANDATYDLGQDAKRFRKGYFRDALVIPVGVDKYATS